MSWLISISENEFYLNSCMKFSRYIRVNRIESTGWWWAVWNIYIPKQISIWLYSRLWRDRRNEVPEIPQYVCPRFSSGLIDHAIQECLFLDRIIDKSKTLLKIRQPPIFPGRLQPSIVGRVSLNHRVRDGNGCDPDAHRHRNIQFSAFDSSTIKQPLLLLP